MTIVITGAAGQDGILLARKLIKQGKHVFGLCRKTQCDYLKKMAPGLNVVGIDLTDFSKLYRILNNLRPIKIFNLAGYSSVSKSWVEPSSMSLVNSVLPAHILSWIVKESPATQIIQASSSEIFGNTLNFPQSENTELKPVTPYGLAKSFTFQMTEIFRDFSNVQATNLILYNHESPLRAQEFVTRHITRSVAKIKLGFQDKIVIGNISMKRDWGWAPDYVDGMILASEYPKSDNFIFATGKMHSVEDLLVMAFNVVGIHEFSRYIVESREIVRKIDPQSLVGNPKKAENILGWKRSLNLEQIIKTMVMFDLAELTSGRKIEWIEGND